MGTKKSAKAPTQSKKSRSVKSQKSTGNSSPVISEENIHVETILVAVTGMSPSVLTETIWALAHEKIAVIPERVVVLTTKRGKEEIDKQLFTVSPDFSGKDCWEALRSSLESEGIFTEGKLRFGTTGNDIRIFTTSDSKTGRSQELDDILTPDQNDAVADFILEEIRGLTENPYTRLLASIAGGRKTMGTLLYACMSIIGRENDRVTHVLVNNPFDNPNLKPKFFFPSQPVRKLMAANNQNINTSKARIVLADVPFVPFRNLFKKELIEQPGSFSSLVMSCRDRMRKVTTANVKLQVRLSQSEILVNEQKISLSMTEYLIIRFFAESARNNLSSFASYTDALEPLREFGNKLLAEVDTGDNSDWRFRLNDTALLKKTDTTTRLNEAQRCLTRNISSLKKKLKSLGGEARELADLLPKGGAVRLKLPAENITIAD